MKLDLEQLRRDGRENLSESEAKSLLKEFEIPTPTFLLPERQELNSLDLRYPLAVKVDSPDVLHKTEKGGVYLNIHNLEELLSSYDQIKSRFPSASVLVEPMEEQGIEVIVGLIKDPSFGPAIMFGLGGVFTELFRDVAFRALPIDRNDALEMIDDTKGGTLLRGFRSRRGDMEALIDLLLKASRLGTEMKDHLNQLDMNPIIVHEKGCIVVDAKAVLEPYSH